MLTLVTSTKLLAISTGKRALSPLANATLKVVANIKCTRAWMMTYITAITNRHEDFHHSL